MERLVRVRIRTAEPLPDKAVVRVSLLDTSRMDVPAEVVSTCQLRPTNGRLDEVAVPVPTSMVETGLVVQVHADLDGTGEITRGDWFTTRSYPVDLSTAVVEVDLTRV